MFVQMILVFFILCVNSRSSGAMVCDALGVCASGTCPPGMDQVKAPARNENYTIRTGDGDPADDPVTYRPGELMDIHFRTTDIDAKPIGILIYAVEAGTYPTKGCPTPGCDGFAEFKVGSWEIANGEPYQTVCDQQALTHIDAKMKNFHMTFHFRAPEEGTGNIIFRAIVKRGPTNGGEFWWPMKDGDLKLYEEYDMSSDGISWLEGDFGESCDKACASQSMGCDASAMSSSTVEDDFKSSVVCGAPLLSACDDTKSSPFKDSDGDCFVNTASCMDSSATCDASDPDVQRICACSMPKLSSTDNYGLESTWEETTGLDFRWLYAFVCIVSTFLGGISFFICCRQKTMTDDEKFDKLMEDISLPHFPSAVPSNY